jgi:hypothetical protein
MEDDMGKLAPALMLILMPVLMPGAAALADTASLPSVLVPVPLNQVSDPLERITTARVTDADGRLIGAVQRLELRDGRPARLDVLLLGSADTVSLDAATVRYDAASNAVAASQSVSQLMADPEN